MVFNFIVVDRPTNSGKLAIGKCDYCDLKINRTIDEPCLNAKGKSKL